MKNETFKKGLLVLTGAFPQQKFETEIYWQLLRDLDDESFLKAVVEVCKTLKEIYPGTNLIAILRERSIEHFKAKINRAPKLEMSKPSIQEGQSIVKMFDDTVKKLSEEKSA